MHPEYKQQITGTLQLRGWNRVKAALDEQERYAISEYSGLREPLTVCCRHCGETATVLAKSLLRGGYCRTCRRSGDIIKLKAVLQRQDRIWLNEAAFTTLAHSMIHTRCSICGHESTQASGNIFYSGYGCPGRCYQEKMHTHRRNTGLAFVQTQIARGQARFERALNKQNRRMVGTYKQRKVKVAVECLSCGAVADVFPSAVIEHGVDCQACKSRKGKRPEKTKTMIGINMSADMAAELEKRAESMHLASSKYCKLILRQWMESGKKLTLQEK